MTNYLVTVKDDKDQFVAQFDMKIKHFRLNKGREINTHGGFTALVNVADGSIYYSKCRDTEQFSRKKGILTCLQKMVRQKNLVPLQVNEVLKDGYKNNSIFDFEFQDNAATIWLGTLNTADLDWWLHVGSNL